MAFSFATSTNSFSDRYMSFRLYSIFREGKGVREGGRGGSYIQYSWNWNIYQQETIWKYLPLIRSNSISFKCETSNLHFKWDSKIFESASDAMRRKMQKIRINLKYQADWTFFALVKRIILKLFVILNSS